MAGGVGRNPWLLVGLVLVMFLGSVVYLRLWFIDYSLSSDDTEVLRRQFNLANREAMDESAEWRLKFDQELKRAQTCVNELTEVKENLKKRMNEAVSMNKKLAMLQQENTGLIERVGSLSQELQTEKLKCSLR